MSNEDGKIELLSKGGRFVTTSKKVKPVSRNTLDAGGQKTSNTSGMETATDILNRIFADGTGSVSGAEMADLSARYQALRRAEVSSPFKNTIHCGRKSKRWSREDYDYCQFSVRIR